MPRSIPVSVVLLVAVGSLRAQNAINLDPVATGLTAPIGLAHANDDRLFIVEQRGLIRIIQNGTLLPTPFLDVSARLVEPRPGFDERGLLGLAFHPDYFYEGRFFIYYSAPRPPDTEVTFEEPGIPVGVNDFTHLGIRFLGGQVGNPAEPELTSSAPAVYQVPAAGTATITFPAPVAITKFFFVHRPTDSPGSVQAFDANGTPRGAPVASRPATFQGDPANFVTLDQSSAGIRELRLQAGASGGGKSFTLFLDDLKAFNYNHKSVISEFRVSLGDPNVADPNSERILLEVNEPQFNHNAGQMAFGPVDRYLYIALGDGGGANDINLGHAPEGNGQHLNTLLGKILRIDVDGGLPYAIPPDNPFVGVEGLDEIWAYGLRNPWRFSFDRGGTRQMFCSDVGQNLFEEVDIIVRGGNYGWRIREGLHCFDPLNPNSPPPSCPNTGAMGEPLIDPIHEYGRTVGISVTGGFVYRGTAMPALVGQYIFGDWSRGFAVPDGSLFRLEEVSPGVWQRTDFAVRRGAEAPPRFGRYVNSFGEGPDGELYVLSQDQLAFNHTTGMVHRMSLAPEVGDFDLDGDVDLSDFTVFQLCFGGSNNPPAGTCPAGVDADLDADGDVDLADFIIFQQNFTGSQ